MLLTYAGDFSAKLAYWLFETLGDELNDDVWQLPTDPGSWFTLTRLQFGSPGNWTSENSEPCTEGGVNGWFNNCWFWVLFPVGGGNLWVANFDVWAPCWGDTPEYGLSWVGHCPGLPWDGPRVIGLSWGVCLAGDGFDGCGDSWGEGYGDCLLQLFVADVEYLFLLPWEPWRDAWTDWGETTEKHKNNHGENNYQHIKTVNTQNSTILCKLIGT